MKKLFLVILIASVFAACNNTPKEAVVVVDTVAIKQKAVLEEQARVTAERNARNDEAAARRAERRNSVASETRVSAESGNTAPAPAKKGWSAAAKGTVIGAGAGAIVGGIIGKNIGGAAIGAAAGGGTGYLIGRAKDRKTGRVVKKPVQ